LIKEKQRSEEGWKSRWVEEWKSESEEGTLEDSSAVEERSEYMQSRDISEVWGIVSHI
jgi:hypothetical protein